MKGTPVKSTDRRKKQVMEALKRVSGGSKVTLVRECDPDYNELDVTFEGEVFRRNGFNDFKTGADGPWKRLGRFYVYFQFKSENDFSLMPWDGAGGKCEPGE